jgi:hypothetical protein
MRKKKLKSKCRGHKWILLAVRYGKSVALQFIIIQPFSNGSKIRKKSLHLDNILISRHIKFLGIS